MQDVARIVLAVESEQLAQDVIDFLDRSSRARVVDTVRDPDAVSQVVERERPDAVVASPFMVSDGSLNGSQLLAIATEESVRVLRRAIEAGACGFFVWPSDRSALASAAARSAHPTSEAARTGKVIAVYGPRGGVGTTFVATHLAAALASRKLETVLVDGDPAFGDLTWALGVAPDGDVRTLADLDPVGDEISEEHVRNVLWPHASGIKAVLASPEPGWSLPSRRMALVVDAAAGTADVVVLHLPRTLESLRSEAISSAAVVLVVVSLDVSAFRAARRAVAELEGRVRWEIVVNRAARSSVTAGDVERVFGKPALCVLPCDRGVGTAQDRGELVSGRSRLGRAVRRLAGILLEEVE